MRYDKLINRIQRATDRYEAEIRVVIAKAAQEDAGTSAAILKAGKGKRKGGKHWTQTAAGKLKLARMGRKAWKSRKVTDA